MTSTAPPTSDQPTRRLRRANRDQVRPVPAYRDALLAEDHVARRLWQAVSQLALAAFTAGRTAVAGGAGQAAADPAILITLWLYATTQGRTWPPCGSAAGSA